MKTIQEILDNYKEYEVFLEDRFGSRLSNFLTIEQMNSIGFKLKEGATHTVKEYTRENILEQLKEDVLFGWEKACDERGISSGLMFEVVKSWNKVLEEGLEKFSKYDPYGKPLFRATAEKYGWELP